ncbi:MAG: PQQ-binding-like beta-propeller repeat protein [Candidatus Aegiribacteria sp.]|nr:PQQ-binding-like beta-propeller repeat protein [Candidatus Aegiribacteria sp.]
MFILSIFIAALLSTVSVTITEPVDGETYNGDWLTIRAIVENENEIPEYVQYTLNGQTAVDISRLNTDWYTYMQNDLHHGFSESPAPEDNTVFWTAPITGTGHEFPTPVVVDGLVYYPQNFDGDTLFALDAATGDVEWIFTGIGSTDDAVTVKDGKLYIASDSIYCLDALTGARIWATGAGNWEGSTPVMVDNRVYCGCHNGSYASIIFCLDSSNGEVLWDTELSGSTVSCMTCWNNTLFVPTYGCMSTPGKLYALDADDGSIEWEKEASSCLGYWDSSPTIVDGVIYIGDCDSYIRAIDACSGETIWEYYLSGGPSYDSITATPAYASGSIYVGTDYHCFASLSSDIGALNWEVDGTIHGSPAVADGIVFFGEFYPVSGSVSVIALSCSSGSTIWTYQTTADYLHGSPSITDGIVYIPVEDGYLYAFGTGLKYTYRDDFFAEVGSNELIVTSFDEGVPAAADTINFTVTETGISLEPTHRLGLCASPNPFHSSASISFELSEPGWTCVTVYELSGRMIRTLENSELGVGQHSIVWDGRRENGEAVSAGLYLCKIQSGEISETIGLCLLR